MTWVHPFVFLLNCPAPHTEISELIWVVATYIFIVLDIRIGINYWHWSYLVDTKQVSLLSSLPHTLCNRHNAQPQYDLVVGLSICDRVYQRRSPSCCVHSLLSPFVST